MLAVSVNNLYTFVTVITKWSRFFSGYGRIPYVNVFTDKGFVSLQLLKSFRLKNKILVVGIEFSLSYKCIILVA